MIPTKIIHKHHFGGRDPRRLTPDDHLYHGDCRLLYEGGATTIAKFCCQITNEQFGKVQFAQKKHLIMLIKMAGYRHFSYVKGFKASLNVSVSGLGVSIFMSFRQTRRSGSTGAFTR